MADFVETYIERIRKRNILKKIIFFFQKILKNSEKYTQKGKIHIEIEKTKLERKKKYIKLGKFISDSYKDEKVIDFTYKKSFFKLNDEIKKIDDFLKKLQKDKDGI